MPAREFNFDGMVGPTHNYAGLSFGNVASASHSQQSSSPRRAALQGLDKMSFVNGLGIGQAILPPLRRPRLDVLRSIGFVGSDAQVIERAWKENPVLVAACYSASSMWTANAATVSPSADCQDGKLHFTTANLSNGFHRSIEAVETNNMLRAIFANESHFSVHHPLIGGASLSDEGAANHTRLCEQFDQVGVELFVYGRSAFDKNQPAPSRYPARQTLEASQAVARRHGLKKGTAIFAQQSPAAIDAGVFHNDVISVGNQNFLLMHEMTFLDEVAVLGSINSAIDSIGGWQWFHCRLSSGELPIEDAVDSYLFNSQLLTRPDGKMTLLCPLDAKETTTAYQCTQKVIAGDNPVDSVEFLDLRQSMNNGGGPACLRLRIALTEQQQLAVHPGVMFSESLCARLKDWVNKHYRDELSGEDLRDPKLIDEVSAAFAELATILDLPTSVFRL